MEHLSDPPVKIRLLDASDRGRIERFFLEEMNDVALHWRFFRTMTPAMVERYVAQLNFEGGNRLFGAFYEERLVGVAELTAIHGSELCSENRPGSMSCAELGIAVSDRLHQQGVGRTLLDALMREGWASGLKRIQLSTLHDNQPMLKLAQRMGFRHLHEEADEVIMQALRPPGLPPPDSPPAPENPTGTQSLCMALLHKARCP